MTKRAILYARVSGDDRANATSSLEGQLEMCRARAAERGYQVVAEFAEDEVSGARIDAPELNRALDMARVGQFDVLIVRELDRLSRSLAKQLIVEEDLRRAGVHIEYVLGEYADTPEGQLNKNIKAVVAEYERLKVAERMTRGRFRKVEEGGILVHGNPPFGYECVRSEQGRRFELVISEVQAEIVRLIFQWYVHEGLTARAVALRLNDMGIPSPRGKKWYPSVVQNMLKSETYAGVWRYGKRRAEGRNPVDSQIVVTVPAIVDRTTWDATQARCAANSEGAFRNLKYNYLLRNRARCHACGGSMGIGGVRPGGRYAYYQCVAARSSWVTNSCEMHRLFRTDVVDAITWNWVSGLLLDPGAVEVGYARYVARLEDELGPIRRQADLTRSVLEGEQAKLNRLLDLYLSGDMPRELLIERKERLESAVSSLRAQYDALTLQINAAEVGRTDMVTLQEFVGAIGAKMSALDSESDFTIKRELVEGLDVRAMLAVEEDEQVIYLTCKIGGGRVAVATGTTLVRCSGRPTAPA